MIKLRARFTKTDRAKYISHLDLYKFMQRTFRRAHIPVWYTEGYNPRPYIMFPLPLSLGYESDCEIMDFNITDDTSCEEIMNRLNAVLPEGIRIISVSPQQMKHTEITKSEYEAHFGFENSSDAQVKFGEFVNRDTITVLKKTKQKTFKEIDLKPLVSVIDMSVQDGELKVTLTMPSGNQNNINPSLLFDSFFEFYGQTPEKINIRRRGIFAADDQTFM
ncbi:MAG: TIGR03936 family radical SAM-associated protein [Oscillospiraceae bacterium]|nr:TIGR03936 family radical SAM-associated protein [Oscillospiraceae bacterium]